MKHVKMIMLVLNSFGDFGVCNVSWIPEWHYPSENVDLKT